MSVKPAPGRLQLVQEFVNTRDVESGQDELSSPQQLAGWLFERGLLHAGAQPAPSQLRRALEVREALRAVLLDHAGHLEHAVDLAAAGATLSAAAARAQLVVAFDGQGASITLVRADGVAGAVGRLLAVVHDAAAQGTWERLKACREDTCQWAFYDTTRNHSGRWCSMEVCGNRTKARSYRARRSASTG